MNKISQFELPLAILRREIAASTLLPDHYARYRPLLADGICFFLERISPGRLRAIFLEQAALPPSAPLERRFVALLHHLPTLHKMGQVLARDRRLAPKFRSQLQELETLEPRTPRPEIVGLLDREIRHWRRYGITLAPAPLAEGSVAVVIPFRWQAGARKPGSAGVFKLLKAKIEELLNEDLAVWSHLGQFLDEECERYHLPALDYADTIRTVRDLLMHEIRLDEEQAHLAEAAQEYSSFPSVIIPELFPFCTPRLTAMQRILGEPLTASLEKKDSPVHALAPVIASALVAQPLFSPRSRALFHADPHAGNLLATPDGRLGILDWSLVGRLGKPVRIALVQLLLGALTQDAGRMRESLARLSCAHLDLQALGPILTQALRELRWGKRLGVSWLTQLLDHVAMRTGAKFQGDLLLFRKSLLTLEGVLADVDPRPGASGAHYLDAALTTAFVRQFAAEWPQRLQLAVASRHWTTHLATADVLSLTLTMPNVAMRYWVNILLDLADSARNHATGAVNVPRRFLGVNPL